MRKIQSIRFRKPFRQQRTIHEGLIGALPLEEGHRMRRIAQYYYMGGDAAVDSERGAMLEKYASPPTTPLMSFGVNPLVASGTILLVAVFI